MIVKEGHIAMDPAISATFIGVLSQVSPPLHNPPQPHQEGWVLLCQVTFQTIKGSFICMSTSPLHTQHDRPLFLMTDASLTGLRNCAHEK